MSFEPNQIFIEPTLLLNSTIDHGKIQIQSILGTGAYGIVYLGRHIRSQKNYAIKLLTNTKVSRSEIAIHSQLSAHTNILTLEKVVQQQGMTFIILEHAPEGDLFTAITHPTHGLMGNNEAIKYIFLQILDAVEYCHQHHVAHRDLKPENILMFPNWKVKLADFGLATCQSVSAEFGCGSTFYFSPECQSGMIRNHQRIKGYSTQQNDIWSLGIILINFSTGRNPWKQANMQDATFAAYVQQPRHFFRRTLPMISTELDRILGRIFCLDPALRLSLPELRLRILKCHSFTRASHQHITPPLSPPPLSNTSSLISAQQHSPKKIDGGHHRQRLQPIYTKTSPKSAPSAKNDSLMQWSGSLTETMLTYIQGYTDEICKSPTKVSPLPMLSPTYNNGASTTLSIETDTKAKQHHYYTNGASMQKQPQQPRLHNQHHHYYKQHISSSNLLMRTSDSNSTLSAACDSLSSSSTCTLSDCSSTLITPDASRLPNTPLSSASKLQHVYRNHQQRGVTLGVESDHRSYPEYNLV